MNETIDERIRRLLNKLTRAERQLALLILENYPVSGLGSITTVAHDAGVSTPTVARMVQKLGFNGFPDFQKALRVELNEKVSNPIAKRDMWANSAPKEHTLNRFTSAVVENIQHSLSQIDDAVFDSVCSLFANIEHKVFVVGGRVTHTLADYFFLHLQVSRPKVIHIQSNSNTWPHYLLDMTENDILVVFDVRRYENYTLKLAEMSAKKKVKIIVFTDQWSSPVCRFATHSFNCRIAVPSSWDSSVVLLLLVEAVIAQVQEQIWGITEERMQRLEHMFDKSKVFRKFV